MYLYKIDKTDEIEKSLVNYNEYKQGGVIIFSWGQNRVQRSELLFILARLTDNNIFTIDINRKFGKKIYLNNSYEQSNTAIIFESISQIELLKIGEALLQWYEKEALLIYDFDSKDIFELYNNDRYYIGTKIAFPYTKNESVNFIDSKIQKLIQHELFVCKISEDSDNVGIPVKYVFRIKTKNAHIILINPKNTEEFELVLKYLKRYNNYFLYKYNNTLCKYTGLSHKKLHVKNVNKFLYDLYQRNIKNIDIHSYSRVTYNLNCAGRTSFTGVKSVLDKEIFEFLK